MSDWTTQAADAIENAVGVVRDRTVEPARSALTVGLFRVLNEIYQGEVWLSWLTLGAIFTGVGAFMWAKRNR
jgi:hypothetical protein